MIEMVVTGRPTRQLEDRNDDVSPSPASRFPRRQIRPHGTLHPPEAAEVQLTIDSPRIIPPEVTDPDERQRNLQELVARMMSQPLAPDAPKFTRDQLHERR